MPKLNWPEPQSFIAIILVVSVVALMFVLALQTGPANVDVFKIVVGTMVGAVMTVVGFYFGSSKSSRGKDDTIAALAGNPAPVAGLSAAAPLAAPPAVSATDVAKGAAVLALFVIIGGLAFGAPSARAAEAKKLQITGDIVSDAKANLGGKGKAATTTSCDFNLFANLTAAGVVSQINNCVQSQVEGVANMFVPDVTEALASAQAAADQTGTACLKPALAIVQAAAGTPGTPAVPATATTPAVAAVPAMTPGPVLIFQKFREFVLANGPASCKSWVNTTISGADPLTN